MSKKKNFHVDIIMRTRTTKNTYFFEIVGLIINYKRSKEKKKNAFLKFG